MSAMSDMPMVSAVRCPLCGQPNRCAMEVQRETGQQQPPCWCTQVDFSPRLLAAVPAQAKGQACICEACAKRPQVAPAVE
jgi:hypothetical protein